MCSSDLGGWRCRQHRVGLTLADARPAAPPPATTFRHPGDAKKFLAYVLKESVAGRMPVPRADSLTKTVLQWNKAQRLLEKELQKRFEMLVAHMMADYQAYKKAGKVTKGRGRAGEEAEEQPNRNQAIIVLLKRLISCWITEYNAQADAQGEPDDTDIDNAGEDEEFDA